jgi:hypothetical protein
MGKAKSNRIPNILKMLIGPEFHPKNEKWASYPITAEYYYFFQNLRKIKLNRFLRPDRLKYLKIMPI